MKDEVFLKCNHFHEVFQKKVILSFPVSVEGFVIYTHIYE